MDKYLGKPSRLQKLKKCFVVLKKNLVLYLCMITLAHYTLA